MRDAGRHRPALRGKENLLLAAVPSKCGGSNDINDSWRARCAYAWWIGGEVCFGFPRCPAQVSLKVGVINTPRGQDTLPAS